MKVQCSCQNCGEFFFLSIPGRVSIVCQPCGCSDVKFDADIILRTVYHGEIGPEVFCKKDEPFFGVHNKGMIWDIDVPLIPMEEKEIDSSPVIITPIKPKWIKRRSFSLK